MGKDEETAENKPDDYVQDNILPLVQHIPGFDNASLVEVGEQLLGDDQHEITHEEIVTLVNSNDAEDIEVLDTDKPKQKKGVTIF